MHDASSGHGPIGAARSSSATLDTIGTMEAGLASRGMQEPGGECGPASRSVASADGASQGPAVISSNASDGARLRAQLRSDALRQPVDR